MIVNSLNILVVDDEAAVRRLTAISLRRRGLNCDEATDGIEAEQLLRDNDYDAVVTDLRMPNRNGHALAVSLLSQPRRPAVIVLTGVLEPRLAEDLLLRGVDGIEFKPVDYKVFSAKVLKILRDRQTTTSPLAKLESTPNAEEPSTRAAGLETIRLD